MEGLKEFLVSLGAYAGPILLLLAELLAGAVAGCCILHGHRRKKNSRQRRNGQDAYQEIMLEGQEEVLLLLRVRDTYPVAATKNIFEMLGVTLAQLQADVELLLRKAAPEMRKCFWKAYEAWDGSEAFHQEFQSAEETWLRLSIVRMEDGAFDLFSFLDISDRIQEMSALQEKLQQAEHASQSKTSFLSQMSHEIRTPMNGITGMLALAQKKLGADHPAMQYVEKAEELSQHMLPLINDILDMSRIEAGKIELESKAFSLREIGEKIRNMFQENAEAKGVRFVVEYQELDAPYVIGDEMRFSQVLINLVSNSMKFTSEGEICITFRQMSRQNDCVDFMVRVHDTGIGMKPEFINRIFLPFEQESVDITKKHGGSGLGMAITDQLVQLMGGEIVIESMPGKGSDFSVFLNLPAAEQSDKTVESVPVSEVKDFTYDGMRVLLAEDNAINAEIAMSMLEMDGAKVELAVNGLEAVDKFAVNPPGYFDFILMDIQMPQLNGLEAAGRIRSMNREDAKKILIFALSADAFVEDRRRSEEAGMNGHFTKPVNFEEMRKQIGALLKG